MIDLLDTNGNFYQFQQLQEVYNIQGTFLDHATLLRNIPAYWKQLVNQDNISCQAHKQNVTRNYYINYLCKDKKRL